MENKGVGRQAGLSSSAVSCMAILSSSLCWARTLCWRTLCSLCTRHSLLCLCLFLASLLLSKAGGEGTGTLLFDRQFHFNL